MTVGVTIALIGLTASFLGQFGAIVWFAATMRQTISHLTKTINGLTEELARISAAIGDHDKRLAIIEDRSLRE